MRVLLLALSCLLLANCEKAEPIKPNDDDQDEQPAFIPVVNAWVSGTISFLENQTEHSGIYITLAGLDTFVVTDSAGAFTFGPMTADSLTPT